MNKDFVLAFMFSDGSLLSFSDEYLYFDLYVGLVVVVLNKSDVVVVINGT